MARKRASLRGRGNEILMGARQDEQAETVDGSEAQSVVHLEDSQASSVLAQEPERGAADPAVELADPGADDQELSPEWVDLLDEEALSALGSERTALNGGTTADIDLSLPPLATTPARPSRPTDETSEAASPPVEEATFEAEGFGSESAAGLVDAADISEVVEGDVENDSVPASEGTIQALGELEPTLPEGAQLPGPQPDLHPNVQDSPDVSDRSVAFEEPTPPAPMYFESHSSGSAGGAYVPAPREKPEATATVMRARLGGLLHEQATVKPTDEDLEPGGSKGSGMPIKRIGDDASGQPSRPGTEPEVLEYVSAKQRRALWDETLELYQVVPDALSGDENQERALRLLQEAQDILLEKPRQFPVAKLKVGQVQALVSWRRNVNRWSNTYGWGVFVYEVVWIVALVLGLFAADPVANLVTSMAGGVPGIDGLSRLWSTMMWGGLGGVMGAVYSLYWHVAKVRDFDKQYTVWYTLQPVMGLLLGAFVHLLIGPGFLIALGVNQQNQTIIGILFPYAVACSVGFGQRSIFETIDRVTQVIAPSFQPEQSPVEETTAKEPLDVSE